MNKADGMNVGDGNSGRYNIGDFNPGCFNYGSYNVGDYNKGSYNVGDYNKGNCNAGIHNNGDCNVGNHNDGDFNTGNYNKGNYNVGYFNTTKSNIRMFNREVDPETSKCIKFPSCLFFPLTKWIDQNDMTDKEKECHPEYKINGGYLKTYTYRQAFKHSCENATDKEIEEIKSLPNFDADVFFEISGYDMRERDCLSKKKAELIKKANELLAQAERL